MAASPCTNRALRDRNGSSRSYLLAQRFTGETARASPIATATRCVSVLCGVNRSTHGIGHIGHGHPCWAALLLGCVAFVSGAHAAEPTVGDANASPATVRSGTVVTQSSAAAPAPANAAPAPNGTASGAPANAPSAIAAPTMALRLAHLQTHRRQHRRLYRMALRLVRPVTPPHLALRPETRTSRNLNPQPPRALPTFQAISRASSRPAIMLKRRPPGRRSSSLRSSRPSHR